MNHYCPEHESSQDHEALKPSHEIKLAHERINPKNDGLLESTCEYDADVAAFLAALDTFAAAESGAEAGDRSTLSTGLEREKEFAFIDGDCNESQPCCGDEYLEGQ